MLMIEAIELYRANLETLQRSKETIRSYIKDMKLFGKHLEDKYNCEVYIEDITVEDIEGYLHYTRTVKNYRKISNRRVVITLKSFFTFCVKKKYCLVNIAKEVAHIRAEHTERINLTENEIEALIRATKDPLAKLVFQTLYYTGMRVSECSKLKVNDVDTINWEITVKNGKGSKDRKIPVNEKLRPLLMEYVKTSRLDLGTSNFFCTKSGGISPSYINRMLKVYSKEAGIKKHVTAHILRHSFATNLLKNGVDILRIQKLMGHSSIKTTSIYTHTNMIDLGQAVNAL
jgi:site-specific recombinase XerD